MQSNENRSTTAIQQLRFLEATFVRSQQLHKSVTLVWHQRCPSVTPAWHECQTSPPCSSQLFHSSILSSSITYCRLHSNCLDCNIKHGISNQLVLDLHGPSKQPQLANPSEKMSIQVTQRKSYYPQFLKQTMQLKSEA